MSSYLSNLLTHTTTRYNSLRRTLLSNEDDGDTEDDSHITRVLRAYYTEKGRPFPPWLPPDPNDRRSVAPPQQAQGYGGYGGYAQQAAGYLTSAGGRSQYPGQQPAANTGSRSGLSDLWDPAPAAAPAQAAAPVSLRSGRRPGGPAAGNPNPQAASTLAPPQARPLPSQRAGSYQSVQQQQAQRFSSASVEPSPPGSSAGGGTAQDRLKARLWGGRSSPAPGAMAGGGGGGYEQQGAPRAGANPYDRGGGQGGGNPYGSGGGGGGYGGRR